MAAGEMDKFEADQDKRYALLQSHVSQLAEHFDSVQIVATTYCPQTGTMMHAMGRGNYYACLASVEDWARSQKRR